MSCSCPSCRPRPTPEEQQQLKKAAEQAELLKRQRQFPGPDGVAYSVPVEPPKPAPSLERTFAKSIQVKNGQVCYPQDDVRFDGLGTYGGFAVLSTRDAVTAAGTALHMITGTPTALTASGRIGGPMH